jgi:hypothetical protein
VPIVKSYDLKDKKSIKDLPELKDNKSGKKEKIIKNKR